MTNENKLEEQNGKKHIIFNKHAIASKKCIVIHHNNTKLR